MRVCVLGAGIAGLAAARQLQCEGHQVTVVDQAHPGSGASAANGGQLSYAYVQPLADPSVWRQLPRLLLAPDSPLTLRLQWDLAQWRWGLSFLAACRASVSRRSTGQLLQLAAESRIAFEQWRAAEDPDCDFSASGKLVLYSDPASFAAARRQMVFQQGLGVEQTAVSAAECVEIEPALQHHQRRIAGAIHTPGESSADCHKVCQVLAQRLQEQGARLLFGTQVDQLVVERGRVHAGVTSAGPIEADAFVLALGSASAVLARRLGIGLPVYPLKGYSITLPLAPDSSAAPRVSITDASRKVVFARLGNRLRVAGMAELTGYDNRIAPERIESLKGAVRAMFPDCAGTHDCAPWAGLRPATPTGVPILGTMAGAPDNLLFNTGHGALGFTLAFGSAARIAALLRQPADRPVKRATAAVPAPCSA